MLGGVFYDHHLVYGPTTARPASSCGATDGTTGGTYLVKDINTTFLAEGSNPSNFESPFAVLNGFAYFVADDGVHGKEIWRSDGVGADTMRVTDFAMASNFGPIVAGSNGLYFGLDDKLYKIGGTPGETPTLLDAHGPRGLVVAGSDVYWSSQNGLFLDDGNNPPHLVSAIQYDGLTTAGGVAYAYDGGDGLARITGSTLTTIDNVPYVDYYGGSLFHDVNGTLFVETYSYIGAIAALERRRAGRHQRDGPGHRFLPAADRCRRNARQQARLHRWAERAVGLGRHGRGHAGDRRAHDRRRRLAVGVRLALRHHGR
ncbi:MAG: hypothetical protein WDM81_16280 [Rhizomicrobium sp.]